MDSVMKTRYAFRTAFTGLFALLLSGAGPISPVLRAQTAPASGISRSMEQAIRLYHEGENTEAMDRFMDILVKGSPSEKALANEYISKITLRMNTGVNTVKDRGAEPSGLAEISHPEKEGGKKPTDRPSAAPPVDVNEDSQDQAADQRADVSDRINTKIAEMRRDILLELGRSRPVKVYMGDGVPKAITLDANYFFANETAFRPGTEKSLSDVAGLLFTLGKDNILILPEGSAGGDVKIQNIRRALAMNSYFESRGISKSRLDVNLTGTDVQFPKELTSISGIIILFDYDKEQRLKDTEDLQTKGPKVSLGIYPTAIAVYKNEGAIVEFSVFESPVGTPSWKFQIFQVMKDGTKLLLQELSGSGPMYNQSFWNGRKKFFGAAYPSGRYMFTVTAADVEGRETSVSRLLAVKPTPEEEEAMRAAAARKQPQKETVLPSGVKTHSLTKNGVKGGQSGKVLKKPAKKGPPKKSRPAVKGKPAARSKAKPAGQEPAAEQEPSGDQEPSGGQEPAGGQESSDAGEAAPQGQLSGQVSYRIFFMNNNSLTSASEKRLAQVAETMGYYPMARIRLTGYAYSGEPNADAVADNRVNKVASRLSEKYSIDRSRMELNSKVTESTKPMVEIKLAGNQ